MNKLFTKLIRPVVSAVALLVAAGFATAGTTVSHNAPLTATAGETVNFQINVAFNGSIKNTYKNAGASIALNTAYHINNTSSTPYVVTPTYGSNDGVSNNVQVNGTASVAATLTIPANTPAGDYVVDIVAGGPDLGNPGWGFAISSVFIRVNAAQVVNPPVVTINSPTAGDVLVNSTISVSATVTNNPTSVIASVGGTSIALTQDAEDPEVWTGSFVAANPGNQTITVNASNAGGAGTASVTIRAIYTLTWLPPVTTSKFQSGRTLPLKFRVSDVNGFTGQATAQVFVNNAYRGLATVAYDAEGPYYHLNILVNVAAGAPYCVDVRLGDGVLNARSLTIK